MSRVKTGLVFRIVIRTTTTPPLRSYPDGPWPPCGFKIMPCPNEAFCRCCSIPEMVTHTLIYTPHTQPSNPHTHSPLAHLLTHNEEFFPYHPIPKTNKLLTHFPHPITNPYPTTSSFCVLLYVQGLAILVAMLMWHYVAHCVPCFGLMKLIISLISRSIVWIQIQQRWRSPCIDGTKRAEEVGS